MRLKDKVTLITGGAAGIGKATAKRFTEEGATVVICDVNQEAGEAAVEELGPEVTFYEVDVTDRQAVQQWVDDVVDRYGRVDILINNAGVLRDNQLVKVKDGELVQQMPEADFDLVVAVNLKGVFNCTQAVAPYMIKQGGGVILNASSVVGLDGNFGENPGGHAHPHAPRPPGPASRHRQCLPLPGVRRGEFYLRRGVAGRWGDCRRNMTSLVHW